MNLYNQYLGLYPELVRNLESARSRGRMSHAFLVSSGEEQLRNDFAMVLAQIAGCPETDNGLTDPECDFCRKLVAGSYSELHTLYPVGKMYQIKVGDRDNPEPNTVRSFISQFHLTSWNSRWRKIGIIYDADRMGAEAQNALLKTLEEPPADTTIILVTGNPSALLPTTRSRCQQLALPTGKCHYDFAGADELFPALFKLVFSSGDLLEIEENTVIILNLAANLNESANRSAADEFSGQLEQAGNMDDKALVKRLETRKSDAASGGYMRERRKFLSAISCFCFQLFMVSQGVSVDSLPNPEIFPDCGLPEITPQKGEKILKEAELLIDTLKYNVNEELAFRAFALNLTEK